MSNAQVGVAGVWLVLKEPSGRAAPGSGLTIAIPKDTGEAR